MAQYKCPELFEIVRFVNLDACRHYKRLFETYVQEASVRVSYQIKTETCQVQAASVNPNHDSSVPDHCEYCSNDNDYPPPPVSPIVRIKDGNDDSSNKAKGG